MDSFNVAYILMPEKGLFLVRCEGHLPSVGTMVVVALDYGLDVGVVNETAEYNPEVHGTRIPGFQLLRELNDDDRKQIKENEKLASAMRITFLKSATRSITDLRVPHVRLSLGRGRLFLRYVSSVLHPNVTRSVEDLKTLFGISVNAWQMGPRDEVSVIGALGPCGRVCCCASWQKRYPARLTVERFKGESANQVNGVCARFKCCLAFEDPDPVENPKEENAGENQQTSNNDKPVNSVQQNLPKVEIVKG